MIDLYDVTKRYGRTVAVDHLGFEVRSGEVIGFLPSSFQESIGKYLSTQSGMAIFSVIPDPRALTPWTGFAVLLAYGATARRRGAALVRSDAST